MSDELRVTQQVWFDKLVEAEDWFRTPLQQRAIWVWMRPLYIPGDCGMP